MNEGDIKLFGEILELDNVCLITHRTPDADTLGSAFALAHIMKEKGKRVEILCADDIPDKLLFVTDGKKKLKEEFRPDFYVSVDTATRELMGDLPKEIKVSYSIDHHRTNTHYAENLILAADLSSTGEFLAELFKAVGVPLDTYAAEKLYTAISLDTGCFRYSNTTSRTHEIAAELLKFGFDAADINTRLFDVVPIEYMKLESEIVNGLTRYCDGKITVASMTQEALKRHGLSYNDADGISTVSRRVEGTLVGVTLKEKGVNDIRISLRSNGDFDVSAVAAEFGGGGHIRASGCSVHCDIKTAEKLITDKLQIKLNIN